MPGRAQGKESIEEWNAVRDPEQQFSSGIPDFDRILGGGFRRGSLALYRMESSVSRDDVDLLVFPTVLNMLYHSRGVIAVLPSRDSPREFRSRLTRFVTRRRFDSRVRVIDYVGEDRGPKYVVNLASASAEPFGRPKSKQALRADFSKMEGAEKAAQGHRRRPFLELYSFEVVDTLMGSEHALKMFFMGIKRARAVGNLMIGLLGPGLGSEPGIRRMADQEFLLRRTELGLTVQGVQPSFAPHLVTVDRVLGSPHASFSPAPA